MSTSSHEMKSSWSDEGSRPPVVHLHWMHEEACQPHCPSWRCHGDAHSPTAKAILAAAADVEVCLRQERHAHCVMALKGSCDGWRGRGRERKEGEEGEEGRRLREAGEGDKARNKACHVGVAGE